MAGATATADGSLTSAPAEAVRRVATCLAPTRAVRTATDGCRCR